MCNRAYELKMCVFAGPKQQKPAQHFIHIVPKSFCYCGIYTWSQHRHVSGKKSKIINSPFHLLQCKFHICFCVCIIHSHISVSFIQDWSFHRKHDRLCGNRHSKQWWWRAGRSQRRGRTVSPKHDLPLRMPHHVWSYCSIHCEDICCRLWFFQKHLSWGKS